MSQRHGTPHSGGQGAAPRPGGQAGAGGGIDQLLAKIVFTKDALPAEIFSDIAEEAARRVKDSGGKDKNTPTQLRRFYDELVMWNDTVQQEPRDKRKGEYEKLEPFIKMLKAKVAYAKGRNHVDEDFKKLFSHCINKIDCPDSLKHCKFFMEAFMGYSKAWEKLGKKESDNVCG